MVIIHILLSWESSCNCNLTQMLSFLKEETIYFKKSAKFYIISKEMRYIMTNIDLVTLTDSGLSVVFHL